MKRVMILVGLALCLVWQGAAWAYWGTPSIVDAESSHARMHLEMRSHHHDTDGGLEFDESIASFFHMMSDSASSITLLPAAPVQLLAMASVTPDAALDNPPLDPFLENPLRPPRSRQ
jgi:hypothetical protein